QQYSVRAGRPIRPLQYQVQIESELQLANDDHRGRITTEGHKIAAADLALHLKSQFFEKTFYRTVQRRFQGPPAPGALAADSAAEYHLFSTSASRSFLALTGRSGEAALGPSAIRLLLFQEERSRPRT